MSPKDEALLTALNALHLLSNHRSPWVKEVIQKAMKQITRCVDQEELQRLRREYEKAWRARG